MEAQQTHVAGKELMDELNVGDKIIVGDRSQPLTVARHVTEDDSRGQLVTMRYVEEHYTIAPATDDRLEEGDLLTGEHTGDEFLIVRGPRGGMYMLKQSWSKVRGEWFAQIAFYRMNRDGSNEVFSWENNHDTVELVGHTDTDPEAFAGDIDALERIFEKPENATIWSDAHEGDMSDYNGQLTSDGDNEVAVQVGDKFETSGGEVIEITNERGDEVCVHMPEREDPRGGTAGKTEWRHRKSVESMVEYEDMEKLTDQSESAPCDMPGEFTDKTPTCPRCGSFMATGWDGEGFPSAQCGKLDCGGFMDDQELMSGGYFQEA